MKKEHIVKALKSYEETSGKSQNQLAKEIGISAAQLSNIKNSNWDKISDEMWNRVTSFCINKGLVAMDNWELLSTRNFRIIQSLCEDAQSHSRFLAVAGYTGAGKTEALKHYSNNHKNAYYVLANAIMQRKHFIQKIAQALSLTVNGTIHEQLFQVIERLKQLNRPVLIIDDLGKVRDTIYQLIQIIYDETFGNCGIVIGGTEYLKQYIDKMADKNKLGFRELKRRIAYWQEAKPLARKEIGQIAVSHGITEESALKYLCREVRDLGTLRELILNARRAQINFGIKITAEALYSLHHGDYGTEGNAA